MVLMWCSLLLNMVRLMMSIVLLCVLYRKLRKLGSDFCRMVLCFIYELFLVRKMYLKFMVFRFWFMMMCWKFSGLMMIDCM